MQKMQPHNNIHEQQESFPTITAKALSMKHTSCGFFPLKNANEQCQYSHNKVVMH